MNKLLKALDMFAKKISKQMISIKCIKNIIFIF